MSRTKLFAQISRAVRQARISESPQSRRDFIKASAALTLATAFSYSRPLLASPLDPVLILGAGAAGLSAAYHLQKNNIPFQILEATPRVGGRIMTQNDFGEDGQFIERGAEFIDTAHLTMLSLAKEFNLPVEKLDAQDAGLIDTLCYYQGKLYTEADLIENLRPLLAAIDLAEKNGAKEIYYYSSTADLKWDRMTVQEFLDSTRGSVAEWLRGIVAVAYTCEFGRDVTEQSALNLITEMGEKPSRGDGLYGASDENMQIQGGNSRLPNAMAAAISVAHPKAFLMGAMVVKLAFKNSKITVTYTQNGQSREISSSHAICTLPFTVLRQVEGIEQMGLSLQKVACIQNLNYGQNIKTILEFKTKLWRKGNSLAPPSTGSIYGAFKSQSYWDSSRMQNGTSGILACFQGGSQSSTMSMQTIRTVLLPDLENLYPGITQAYVKGTLQNWPTVPTVLGSYSCLLAGQYSQINGAQGEPELGGRLLFAGEHTSDEFQGYMNGAFQTGLEAAKKLVKSLSGQAAV